MSFQDEKKHIAKFEANKYMDKTIRHGLSMHGGSILEFIVHPSAILTVSIQDMQLATEEEELGKEETTEAV